MTGRDDRGDLMAPQERPRRVAVEEDDHGCLGVARVDDVHAELLAVAGRDLDESPLGRVVGQSVGGALGRSEDLHQKSTRVGSVSDRATSSTVGSAMTT